MIWVAQLPAQPIHASSDLASAAPLAPLAVNKPGPTAGLIRYNPGMPDITLLRPERTAEAKRVIYTVAHKIFHDRDTLEETIAYYELTWQLQDIDDFQHSYIDNGGTFLVIIAGGRIIGTGALRRLEDTIGEIKRLWLLPEYQGLGLGYRMMVQLLALAREKGYTKVRLETSPAYQRRAFAFYQRLGFYEIPRYGEEQDDVAMELELKSFDGAESI